MTSLAGLLLVGVALADAADDLAREIERTIDDIAAQIRIQPERALAELNEQERQLETLIQIEPQHPAIRELQMRLDELEARLADPTDTPVISAPSADIARSLRRLRSRLKEAETAWLSKDEARAARILHEVRLSLCVANEARRSLRAMWRYSSLRNDCLCSSASWVMPTMTDGHRLHRISRGAAKGMRASGPACGMEALERDTRTRIGHFGAAGHLVTASPRDWLSPVRHPAS